MWAVLVIFAALIFWATRRRPGNVQSGPTCYPLVGVTFELLRNKDRILEWETDYLIKEPTNTIFAQRPGDNGIRITANPEVVEHILKTNFENYPKGNYFGEILGDLLGSGIFNADGDVWRMQRKLASHEFTTRSLRDFVINSLAQEVENRLLPTLFNLCEAGNEFDLQDVFMRLAFDNICKLAFGVDPACLGPDFPDVKFARAFDTATSMSSARFLQVHPVIWKVMRMLNIGSERKLKEALVAVDEFAAGVIQTRREALDSGECDVDQDLLSRFIAGDRFSDKFLRDIIISFVLAGKDTTSVTLTWFFWSMFRHPEVKRKIIEEVDRIVSARENLNKRKRWSFSYEELREMQYLHAAISESLRLYPAVPVNIKAAKGADVLPNGMTVEKGMRVNYHIYAMGRMEKLWGKDCLEFKPERWINGEGSFVPESVFKFTAFQGGPRVCLGREMAMLQMKFIVAALLPLFEFDVVRKDQQKEAPPITFNMTLQMRDGLIVRTRTRTWTV